MLKLKTTKLALGKETVRVLSGATLAEVRGGVLKSAWCGYTEFTFCLPPQTFENCETQNLCNSFADCDITYGNNSCAPNHA